MVEGGPAAVTAILGDRDSKSQDSSGDEDGGGEPELKTTSESVAPATFAPVLTQSAPLESATSSSVASQAVVEKTEAPSVSASSAAPLDKEEFLKSLGL